ncbi:hypothetical protein [Mesorhizobium sp. BHbdii]
MTIRLLHQTELFRPYADPDDHWDLACVYALAAAGLLDLGGVLVDVPPEDLPGHSPGFRPVEVKCDAYGAIRWMVSDGKSNRFLFEVNDVDAYASAMTTAMTTLLGNIQQFTNDAAHPGRRFLSKRWTFRMVRGSCRDCVSPPDRRGIDQRKRQPQPRGDAAKVSVGGNAPICPPVPFRRLRRRFGSDASCAKPWP